MIVGSLNAIIKILEIKIEVIIMTKTFNRFLSVLLAIAVIFSFAVIGSAAEDTFALKSGDAAASTGSFKNNYVGELKITVVADSALTLSDGFALTLSGTDGQNKSYNRSNASVSIDGQKAVITVSFESGMSHASDYTFTVAEGSFTDANGKTNEAFSFTESGNLILEHLNVDRPSTTMQRFIKWLSSWEYAKYIMPIINLLKWFDSL